MARDPYKYFRVEARELNEQLTKGVLDLEKGEPPAPLIAQLLRVTHTLKGAARVVKQREIADRAHSIETILLGHRETASPFPAAQIDPLLRAIDEISRRTAALAPATDPALPAARQQSSEEVAPILRSDEGEIDALLDGLSEAGVQLATLRQGLASVARARRLSHQLSEQLGMQHKLGGVPAPALKLRSMAAELRDLYDSFERDLTGSVEQMDRELRQVREGTERLRLLPARAMFNVLERTARDAAQNLEKRVIFAAAGGEVKLETSLLALVQTALVQAVRNALAHGIESESERLAAQKSAEGRVWIEVERRGDRTLFRCRDDGRGVSLDAVRHAAERKGVLTADSPELSQQATLDLLLKAGLSTASSVTEIAGRGVGLDLIRDVTSRLGGELRLTSQAGAGMTLEISLPASLSSVDALIVEALGRTAAIPLDRVQSTLRIAPNELIESADGMSLIHEGKVLPFTTLARALRLPGKQDGSVRAWSAVVIRGEGALAAVGVDRLRGTENVVVRPLPALVVVDPVVAGASLDTGGNPQLLLDADGLVNLARSAAPVRAKAALPREPVLVIDDSLTTRMLEQSILESAGYEVETATSAEEALVMARRRRYCLFLVDVEMPGMDGFEFVETTRADATLREVPAILVTSRSAAQDRRRGQSAGASGYIVKNEFEQTELLELIRSLVSAR